MISENSVIITELINKVKMKSKRFDENLKEQNDIITQSLNLKELEQEKSNFRENMSKFEELNISNSVSSSSDSYVSTYQETWTEGFWFWKETKSKQVYDHSKTTDNYKSKLNTFFTQTKKDSLDNLEKKKQKTVDGINGIVGKFNEEINGFKKNIDEFKKIVDQVEDFIYKTTGIK